MKLTTRNHAATSKAQAPAMTITSDKPPAELAEQFSVHPAQITE